MTDVAREAGVSQATVSYVINGRAEERRIPAATVEKIMSACERLNYKPNYLATAMATRKTGVIGLIFANADGDFMGRIIRGAQDVLHKDHHQIQLSIADDRMDLETEILKSFEYRQVDGIIGFPVWTPRRSPQWAAVLKSNRPVVFIDMVPNGIADADCVGIDNQQVGREAAELFCREGVERLVMIGEIAGKTALTERRRRQGFLDGAKAMGFDSPVTYSGQADMALLRALSGTEGPKIGVFAPLTSEIVGVLRRMLSLNLPINPKAVFASCGVDGEPFFVPNTWWMAEQPELEIGRRASEYMLQRLGGQSPAGASLVVPFEWRINRLRPGESVHHDTQGVSL